jgi:hypothetical protein
MTVKMPHGTTTLGRRAYGGDTADRPSVRGVRARTAALTPGRLGLRALGRGASGWSMPRPVWPRAVRAWTPGQGRAAGGDGGARVRTTSRVAALCAQVFCWCPVQVDFSLKI